MLKMLGYGLQSDKKALTATESHADRDAQIEYINEQCKQANARGIAVISIDAKKKENVGNFKNNGRTYQLKGNPIKVFDHDFPLKELGKENRTSFVRVYIEELAWNSTYKQGAYRIPDWSDYDSNGAVSDLCS